MRTRPVVVFCPTLPSQWRQEATEAADPAVPVPDKQGQADRGCVMLCSGVENLSKTIINGFMLLHLCNLQRF